MLLQSLSCTVRHVSPARSRFLCCLLIFAATVFCDGAQNGNQESLSSVIDSLVQQQIKAYNIPGLAISVTSQHRIIFSHSYGWADLENQVRVTPETLFRIGSITKPITATATMALAERGHLDIDAPVQRYCKLFPEKDWTVSTRELLAHLGGVRAFHTENGSSPELLSNTHYERVSDSIALFANDPLVVKPGTQYEYSNYGYDLIGCVVEGASGKAFGDLLRSTVFLVAGMNATQIDDNARIIPGRSRSYTHAKDGTIRNAKCIDLSNRIPAAGILSTADNVARFVLALESGKILSAKSLQSMWAEQMTESGKHAGYSLGWMIRDHHGKPAVAHTGEQPGSSTILYVVPASNISFVVLANNDAAGLWKLADRLADLLD